jgi:hypothetical protein
VKRSWRVRWFSACLLMLAACAGTEAGNPPFDGTLSYAAYSKDVSVAALRVGDGQAPVVQTAWLALGDVRFVPAADCTAHAEAPIGSPALGVGDHASGHATKTRLELAEGSYCAVRLPLLLAGANVGNAPAALPGHSMLIEGRLADGSTFSIRSRLNRELYLGAQPKAFEMSPAAGSVLIAFDLSAWLKDLDFTTAQSQAGVLIVDEGHNPELLRRFEQNVVSGTALYRDAKASGEIDPSVAPLASGR